MPRKCAIKGKSKSIRTAIPFLFNVNKMCDLYFNKIKKRYTFESLIKKTGHKFRKCVLVSLICLVDESHTIFH